MARLSGPRVTGRWSVTTATVTSGSMFGKCGTVNRTQRHPRYKPQELQGFMSEVCKGYPFREAAERAGLHWKFVENALCSDDDLMGHCLQLSMVAGEKVRRGIQPAPDRRDKLYEEYRCQHYY
jgi:hypothetical protein